MFITKFSDDVIRRVWEKGYIVGGTDPNKLRKDTCGAWIAWSLYGNRDSKTNAGWEIDHIIPESRGGTDDISNLRPLQWYNNADKQDGALTCPMKAKT